MRLPADCEVVVFFGGDVMQDLSPTSLSLRRVAEYMASRPHKTIGNDVFAYSAAFADDLPEVAGDDAHFSVWLMKFYDVVDFLCVTRKKLAEGEASAEAGSTQTAAGAQSDYMEATER